MESELLKISKEDFEKNKTLVHIVDNEEQNNFINDLEDNPNAFLLACIMDRQTHAEKVWAIPYKIYKKFGTFDIEFLANIPLNDYEKLFKEESYHRYNNIMPKVFYEGVNKIKNDYDGDGSKIWSDNPSSASVVSRLLEFHGVGLKIATMTANILVRQFDVPMSDTYSIDISPDVHVKRIFVRLGYLQEKPSDLQVMYKAREINPEYPGIIDHTCWTIGREYCHKKNPECNSCPLNIECKYYKRLNK